MAPAVTSGSRAAPDAVVAMSGGVDSSVAAWLARREGRALAALTMRLSDEGSRQAPDGRCCAARDVRDARRVAAGLGLPHHVVDLRERFEQSVVAPFVDAYLSGRTPIPCVACNDRVKFRDLLRRARALGASKVVTGHYARVSREGDRYRLLRGSDRAKDQSYFLHGLDQAQLAAAEFPLGALTKEEVRRRAAEAGLAVADKPESQEICFIPDGDTAGFVERAARARGLEPRPGAIVDREGRRLGEHRGVHAFTVGQRRGLGAHGRRLHVLELRADEATVVAGSPEHLACRGLEADAFHWISGRPPEQPLEVEVQVRHARATLPARVTARGGGVRVELAEPHAPVAPGQAVVAYRGEEVLGGGPISRTFR